jgi:hypothetical protein
MSLAKRGAGTTGIRSIQQEVLHSSLTFMAGILLEIERIECVDVPGFGLPAAGTEKVARCS